MVDQTMVDQKPMLHAIGRLQPMVLGPLTAEPKVSILVANYNYGHLIGETLASVYNQTYRNFEICICDDGSSDHSRETIIGHAGRHAQIKYIFQANQGVGQALNSAYSLATGEIVALLDADDVWLPKKLEAIVNRFRLNNQAGMVVHPVRQVSQDLRETLMERFPAAPASGWCGVRLLSGELIGLPPCSGLSFRSEVAARIFPLDPAFRQCADGMLRDLATLITTINVIDEPLGLMRIHGANLTTTTDIPSDLGKVLKVSSSYRKIWEERSAFAKREFGLDVSTDRWVHEGVIYLLLERLLTKQPVDPTLIHHVRSLGARALWQMLFLCPFHSGGAILRNFWTPASKLKRTFKRIASL